MNNQPSEQSPLKFVVRCLASLMLAVGIAAPLRAQPPSPDVDANAESPSPKAPADSLDAELLKDLDDGLLEGLDDLPLGEAPAGAADRDGAENQPDTGAAPQVGDDLGASEDPIVRIGRKMQRAESQIAGGDTGAQTLELQREIAAEIQELIERVKQQNQSQQGQQSGSQQSAAGQQAGEAGQPQTQSPSSDSTDRVGTSDQRQAELERLRALYKEAWGHLPARVRERMQSASAEEFLPKYERMIEEYFKRLAEESDGR